MKKNKLPIDMDTAQTISWALIGERFSIYGLEYTKIQSFIISHIKGVVSYVYIISDPCGRLYGLREGISIYPNVSVDGFDGELEIIEMEKYSKLVSRYRSVIV